MLNCSTALSKKASEMPGAIRQLRAATQEVPQHDKETKVLKKTCEFRQQACERWLGIVESSQNHIDAEALRPQVQSKKAWDLIEMPPTCQSLTNSIKSEFDSCESAQHIKQIQKL